MSPSLSEALLAALLSSWPSLLLDGLLLFLLLCAVLYAVRLSRAVSAIHRGKAELAWLFARFAENIARAEKLLTELKRSALESQEGYLRRKEETDSLKGDLDYLIEKGNRLADQLEESIGMAKETASAAKRKHPRHENITPRLETRRANPASAKLSSGENSRESSRESLKETLGRNTTSATEASVGIPNLHNLR